MSYGPQLPPHLQKLRETAEDEEKSESGSSDDDDSMSFGPKLPDQPCMGPKPQTSGNMYGPVMPAAASVEEDSSDDDVIGPRPPNPGEEVDEATRVAREFEERSRRMKDKIEGRSDEAQSAPKRETWMLELPPELTKNFGLGARTFTNKTGPKTSQDKSWTKAPNDSTSKDEDNRDSSQDDDVLEYMASLRRDEEMEKVATQLREKRGTESLMDRHSKKLKKEKKESKTGSERRPFDRDVDLNVNQFDEAQKSAMLKKAAQLNDRFSSGNQKFL